MTTKNTGTRNTASTVAVIMPPITPVPIARWLAEPAPVEAAAPAPRRRAQAPSKPTAPKDDEAAYVPDSDDPRFR